MEVINQINSEYLKVDERTIRTKFSTELEIDNWVKKLMEKSKVTWSITRTIRTQPSKAKKNTFKRMYHCHFNTRPSRILIKRQRKHARRNTACAATLTITLAYTPKCKSRSKSPISRDIIRDWPCKIQFTGEHNHTILSATALVHRPICESTKKEIIQYFERGHSVASAYHSFCFKKMEEFGDSYNTLCIDRHFFPTKNDFQNLFKSHSKENYTEQTDSNMFNKLQENLMKVDGLSFKFSHIGDDYAISLCTPLMKRASEYLIQASEILFVDATSNCDVQNHKLYFFATQSAAGGIPLGCIISTSEKEELFEHALNNLLEINLQNILPKIILTDDDTTVRKVVQKRWPSSTLLLRTFHVLKAIWKWLIMARNKIPEDQRLNHYRMFKNILNSTTQEELDINIATFHSECKFHNYKVYVDGKIEKDITAWCLYYRKTFLTRGSDNNNIVEVMFRLFRDIPRERTKPYNLIQLVDFVVTDFESYFKQRLLDSRFNNGMYPNEKVVPLDPVKELNAMEFCVVGHEDEPKYFVGTEDYDNNDSMDAVSNTDNDYISTIEGMWSDFITKFSDQVKKGLKDDPLAFTPAVETCIKAYQKHVNSSASLISSLSTLFQTNDQNKRTQTQKQSLQNISEKDKKTGTRSTCIAKRKALAAGRRKLRAEKHVKSLAEKIIKACHSLSECVDKNISLGDDVDLDVK